MFESIIISAGYDQVILICICTLLLICFFQSGIDKIYDYRGNVLWLNEHFSKTFFKNVAPVLVVLITLLELTTAFLFALGIMGFVGLDVALIFSAITLLCLFLGQRIAKDYVGAYVIVVYFILTVLGLFVFFINNAINTI